MLKKIISKRIIFIFGIFLGLAAAFYLGAYAESMQSSAVYYDNTTSGGSSNTVSGALDELYEKAKNIGNSGDCPEGMTCKYGTSFAEDSWETIQKAVRTGNYIYKVGDTKTIDMGSLGTHTVRVANTSSCTNGETSQTACGFVVEFIDIITTHNMNTSNTSKGGWPASAMRTYINNTIYNALPSDLKNVIADTTVVSGYGSGDSANFTSTDKLYLFSTKEIYGTSNGFDEVTTETRQLDNYKNQGITTSNPSAAIKQYNGSNYRWWLRSARSYDSDRFFSVSTDGSWDNNTAINLNGVAPAFRIA